MEPETILPSQFFAGLRSNAAHYPERRLMLAVLADAVTVFQRYASGSTARARRRFTEAADWFLATEDGPFSFTSVCDALELDPDYIRQGLSLWRRQCASGKPPAVVRLVIRDRSGTRHGVNGRPHRCAGRRRA